MVVNPSRYILVILAVLAATSWRARADFHRELTGDTDGRINKVSAGNAPGRAGTLQIAEGRSGRVLVFEPQDTRDDQPVQEAPRNKGLLLQGSGIAESAAFSSPEMMPNLWDVMLTNGCGRFAELVTSTGDAAATYNQSIHGGLTVFCPEDKAVEAFAPAFNKLKAGARLKLVLYHALQPHYSIRALKVNNGAMSTLATDGNTIYNVIVDNEGDDVTLLSAARKAAIVVRTLMDDGRLVVHRIDTVLLPSDFAELSPADLRMHLQVARLTSPGITTKRVVRPAGLRWQQSLHRP
ncbi:unnamed protein product [Urochloa humidicola]